MGYVREQRATKLLEDTLLTWLEDGKIPTTGELQEAYDSAKITHGDLTRSKLRQITPPARWEESSATRYNSVLDALESDLDVLLRALINVTDLGLVTLEEWNTRGRALAARISHLKLRIESLLLLKSDTAGFLSFVEDGFLSLENVSSDTTAYIDMTAGEVTLKTDNSEGTGKFQGTQIDLNKSQFDWTIIESGNVRFSANPAGSDLGNIGDDRLNRWGLEANAIRPDRFRTASKDSKPVMGELKVKLEEKKEVSKIVLLTSDATAGDNSVVGAQYSVDGYTWENIPSESPVQSGTGNFVWRFPKTEMQWVKFIVSKASPDYSLTESTTYDFGFDRVRLYEEVFLLPTEGAQMVSELLTPRLGGADVTFGRASLEVCEELPSGTSLRYYLRAYNGSSYSEWVQVSPISRGEPTALSKGEKPGANKEISTSIATPAVVDFAAPTSLSSETLTTTFDSSIDAEALNIMRVDGSGNLSYRFNGPDDTVANFYISQNDNLLTDLILLRNAGYPAAKYPSVSDGDLKVGDIECGWGLDGDSIYYCVFLINRPNGLTMDFGHTQAVLDNRVVSGVEEVSAGWHTFRTDRANWAPLSSSSAPTNTTELDEIDPLYPYNHKYLIEGYNYPSTWNGNKVYLGVDEYGQYKATRTGRHSFTNSERDLSIYALDVISGPKTIVLLKFNSSRPNHKNERVRLFYTRRFDSFEGIQAKAILNSTNVEKTPVLSYYRVRVK